MNVLIVGGGGREHALLTALSKSRAISKLYVAPGNGGMASLAECVSISATDIEGLTTFATENQIDYVVVAPDDPLCLGLVDRLKEVGIPAFGPSKAAARIEGSKAYSKELMKRYHIPTAGYETFTDVEKALAYVNERNCPLVVKADGLALGKGVLLCDDAKEASDAVVDMLTNAKFGKSSECIVIEDYLQGPEVTVLCFTDGKTIVPMPSSMDHKRALDGDEGLNTGGMGVIAPNPYYTKEIANECMETIFLPTLKALQEENAPFTGCLYFGLMLTKDGPKVIEYNCRFGDPETQALMPLLQSDLFTIMKATTEGTLSDKDVVFSDKASCCVVLASGGYPKSYASGKVITGLDAVQNGTYVYHAGTKKVEDTVVSSGGRVLAVTTTADTLAQAIQSAYEATTSIHFDGMHKRNDIGQLALKAHQRKG